jgi:hypothetical protein
MKTTTKRQNSGLSTVVGSVLFILAAMLVASILFVALSNYNADTQQRILLEQSRTQERLYLTGLETENSTGLPIITTVTLNNTGSITIRIRGVYVNNQFICDPSDFDDTYVNAKESKTINLHPADMIYDRTNALTLTTERGTKTVEYEGKLKGDTEPIEPTEVQKVYFGPLLLNFEKFYYTETTTGLYDPNAWKPGWTVEKGTTLVWNVTVKNIDDRDITINQYSCLTLESNDGAAAQKPWYIEPVDGTNTIRIDANATVNLIYIWDTARTTATKTQSVYQQPCRSKIFLTFFGVFHEKDGTTKPYGQTIPFQAVQITDIRLTLGASPTIIAAGSTMESTITATAYDVYGAPAANAQIVFSTTLGTLQSTTAITDSNGVATTILHPGSITGSANITATYENFTRSTIVTITTGSVTLTANPTTIAASSTMTSTVTATVRLGGNAVSNSPVEFETTLGSVNPISTITNLQGQAITTLSPGNVEGPAMVTATWFGLTGSTTVRLTEGTITLNASPIMLAAGSTQISQIEAMVLLDGNPMPNSIVYFITNLGTLSGSSATTNPSGVATVSLVAASTSGTATVTATWQGLSSSAEVEMVQVTVTVSALEIELLAGSTTTSSTITAVFSFNQQPLINEIVTFQTNLGTLSSSSLLTNIDGSASVVLYPGSTSGSATVEATWDGIRGETNVWIAEPSVILSASTPEILVNSADSSTITASLYVDGIPVEGATLDFSTDLGSLDSSTATTDNTGVAHVTLNAGSTPGTATVILSWQGISRSIPIEIIENLAPTATPLILTTASPLVIEIDSPILFSEATRTVTETATTAIGLFSIQAPESDTMEAPW